MKWLLVLVPWILSAQIVELGPAPRAPENVVPEGKTIPGERAAGPGGVWYDTATRETVRTLYNSVYAPTNSVSMGWTGAVASCTAGVTSQAWRDAVAVRINWFRGMAGVPTGVVLNSGWNAKDQDAALMMSANSALNHFPPASWTCYTANGAEAAGNSNLCYRFNGSPDPGCVAGYIADTGTNNTAVGHRRWILYPQTATMGTGDVPQTGGYPGGNPLVNALWILDSNFGTTRPSTRDGYVAWPPKGYVPYQTVYERWSFAYPDADFSAATVTMTRDGSAVSVTKETVETGYGENTIVWLYNNMPTGAPANDATVTVTISGITGAPQTSYTYQVIIIDPAHSGGGSSQTPVTVTTNPPGLTIVVDGTNYTSPQSFNWTASSQHTVNAPSPQQTSGIRYTFSNWSHGGAASQSITAPGSSTTYTANYATQYLLTTGVSPAGSGTIAASPASADGYYASGTQVQLTASASGGNIFSGWSGSLSGSANPQTLTMSLSRSVTAAFSVATPPVPVTITSSPTGRSIVVDSVTYTAPQSFNWIPGSQHTVSAASPQQTTGVRYLYTNWSQGGAAAQTLTAPTSPATYTVNFNTQYLLSTGVSPAGAGTINASPSSADGYYASGTPVQLTASGASGNAFTSWSGALSGSANPQTVILDAPRSVSAAFTSTGCGSNYVLSPQTWVADTAGGAFSVNVATAAGCSWSAVLPAGVVNPFLAVTGAGSGTGSGSFQFTALPNGRALPRTGTIAVMGQLVQILQHGSNVTQVFSDVPSSHLFFDYITLLQANGVTNGCGGGQYCPDATTSRGQMAELVIRSKLGDTFPFQPAPFFTDVPANHAQFKYIQKMKELGITDGCTATTYCPSNPVNRGEMAVFLIRGKLGVLTPQQFSYNPTPYFADVPTSHLFFAWIQKMKELGITGGCTVNTYCGYDPNTLGQIAVFLVRSFETQ